MYVSYYDKIAITNLSGKFLCRIRRLVRSTKIFRANQSVSLRAIIALIKVSTNPRLLPFQKHRLDQRRTDEISFVGRLLVSGKALFFNLYAHPILLQRLYSHHVCRVSLFWREFWKGRSTCKGSWTTARCILVLWRVLCLVVCSVSSSIPYFYCVAFSDS